MSDDLRPLDDLRAARRRAAVATLVATRGATPRKEGARMWVDEAGHVVGSVTIGGCVDARVIEESESVLAGGTPRAIEMELGDEDAWALGMTCGGAVRLLIEPVDATRTDDPVARSYEAARAAVASGARAVIVAPLDEKFPSAARLVVRDDGSVDGSLGDATLDAAARAHATEVLDTGASRVARLGEQGPEAFLELHAPPIIATIFGATHVAMPLSVIARELGWRTVVVDGRERFATRERFPLADEIRVGIPSEIARAMRYDASSLVIVVAHDYKYDVPVLEAVLAQEPAYVGLLGSARRGRAILDFLRDAGVPPERVARVRVPIGLDIGARSAAEIALAIAAEALAVRAGRPGTPMRDRAGGAGA